MTRGLDLCRSAGRVGAWARGRMGALAHGWKPPVHPTIRHSLAADSRCALVWAASVAAYPPTVIQITPILKRDTP